MEPGWQLWVSIGTRRVTSWVCPFRFDTDAGVFTCELRWTEDLVEAVDWKLDGEPCDRPGWVGDIEPHLMAMVDEWE